MAGEKSDDGWGWIIAIGLGFYVAYTQWWKEPDVAQLAPPTAAARAASYPVGPVATLSNGTEWRMVWSSIKGPPEARLAWVREDHSNNKERDARESLALYKINCTTTGLVTLSIIDYNKDGKVLRNFDDFTDKESYSAPGTVIENVTDAACLPQFDKLATTQPAAP